ncbi:MAG TPA: imidazole glycerol phosphate synthase subunit HisH [Gemmatimonadaceae bacterium]|nr:imidazole glycerol phosphate synthase subunit HisH [Gemmatimonadaceae bacterium]
MTQVSIFDYGAGNLHSLRKAIATGGRSVSVESDIRHALTADILVLPGVGAFGTATSAMHGEQERVRTALAEGKPCLGVCLGMQLLFDDSEEAPGLGLGLIPGSVRRLRTTKVPHIGWNEIEWAQAGDLAGANMSTAYFANAYVCEPNDPSPVLAWTTHQNSRFPSVVRVANTVGVQFHPEKSSAAGLAFVNDVIDELARCR